MHTIVLFRLTACSALLLLAGCSRALDEKQYKQFLRDPAHGLVQQKTSGIHTLTCAYLPTDLLLLQDVDGVEAKRPAAIDSVRKSYTGRTYLSFSLERGNAEIENQFLSNQVRYAQAIEYLGSGIAQDAVISTPAKDSVTAIASAYSRLYGGSGKSTVLLVFDTHELDLSQGFTFTFHDTQFGLGTLHFPFTAAALRALPAVKLESPSTAL